MNAWFPPRRARAARAALILSAALVVAGQMLMSLALDHYGVLGLATRPLEWSRVAGGVLLLVGAWLVLR